MYYVYVLRSKKDGNRYVECTEHLQQRLEQHQQGRVASTRTRKPFELIYCEACVAGRDAWRREKYLKTTGGRRFLAKRLREFLFIQ